MLGQDGGVALASDNGANDRHAGAPGDVGEHAVELKVHLGQGLLHALHVRQSIGSLLRPETCLILRPSTRATSKPRSAQQLVEGNPVDAGALHGDAANPTLLQPIGQGEQAMGHGGEFAHRFSIPIRGHTDPVGFGADVDAGGIGLDHD